MTQRSEDHARHIQLQWKMRRLSTIDFVAHLSPRIIHKYLPLPTLYVDNKIRHQTHHQYDKMAATILIAPVRTNSSKPPMELGKPAAIPAKSESIYHFPNHVL